MRTLNRIAFVFIVLLLSGCVSVKSYVDPNFKIADYDDIATVTNNYQANITVEFQRNGERFDKAHGEATSHVERTFRATGVVTPTNNASNIKINVVINNIANMGEAAAKGFGTGLTFGLAGTAVTDYYEISISYTEDGEKEIKKKYKHALHTTVGKKQAPIQNVKPTTPADGFGKVIEDSVLNFVNEMQKQGKLSLNINHQRTYS